MSAPTSARFVRQLTRTVTARSLSRRAYQATNTRIAARIAQPYTSSSIRCFSAAHAGLKGIMPETEDPAPAEPAPTHHVSEPTPIEDEEYHERADEYLDEVVARVEELAESRDDVDVEYAAGVLSVTFPPQGTYVINKQPPNKQIWLSSPITGPKRFDWVVAGEGQHTKQESGTGEWIYLRDGTSLTQLLRKELGITIGIDPEAS